ncbi:MAG: tetratricopeptide repeat protein [Rhodospirillales bacterium]
MSVNYAAAQNDILELVHRDIYIIAIPKKAGVEFDTSYLSQRQGIDSIRKAIEVIYAKSPFSVSKLEELKKNGTIVIAYDPGFQEGKIGNFALAAFFPDFYDAKAEDDGNNKRFVVKVGRHAVKWPKDELAMIIVHELVGHGIQRLKGHLEYIRELDLECAANLYGERFYQDIGIDKSSADVVKFSRELEDHWCSDFKNYMRARDQSLAAMWDVLNPDVPRLLAVFEDYVKQLREKGTSQKAISAANKMRRDKHRKWVGRVEAGGEAEEQYKLGISFREGLGVERDFKLALKWFQKSAEQGNADAQVQLADMHAKGQGTPENLVQAGFWLSLAAELHISGTTRKILAGERDSLLLKLTPADRDAIRKKVKSRIWNYRRLER